MIVQNVVNNKVGLSLFISQDKRFVPLVGAAIAGGLASGGLSLIGGAVNSIFGGRSQRKENARNREHQELMLQRQQEYNDKINAENREWQDESNVRARIEKAGYNPYLYNGQANAQSVASNSAGSAPVENMPSGYNNSLGQGISNMGNSFSQVLGAIQDYKNKDQEYQRNGIADAYVNKMTGANAGVLGATSYAQIQQANSVANLNDAVKFHQDMMNKIDQLQYIDQNGVPQTNPDGSPMTLAQANGLGMSRQSMVNVEKAVKEISVLASQGKSIDLDNIVKKWKLDNGYHVQELDMIKQQVRQLQSQIVLNNANAFLAKMQAKTQSFIQDNLYSNTQLNFANKNYINTQNGQSQQRFLFDLSNLAANGDLLSEQSRGQRINNYYNKNTVNGRVYNSNLNNYTNNFLTPQGVQTITGLAGSFLNPMGFFLK